MKATQRTQIPHTRRSQAAAVVARTARAGGALPAIAVWTVYVVPVPLVVVLLLLVGLGAWRAAALIYTVALLGLLLAWARLP